MFYTFPSSLSFISFIFPFHKRNFFIFFSFFFSFSFFFLYLLFFPIFRFFYLPYFFISFIPLYVSFLPTIGETNILFFLFLTHQPDLFLFSSFFLHNIFLSFSLFLHSFLSLFLRFSLSSFRFFFRFVSFFVSFLFFVSFFLSFFFLSFFLSLVSRLFFVPVIFYTRYFFIPFFSYSYYYSLYFPSPLLSFPFTFLPLYFPSSLNPLSFSHALPSLPNLKSFLSDDSVLSFPTFLSIPNCCLPLPPSPKSLG
ncbi:unnamed protein product [Acanthosepion pharaonis]|uniref:Uncharacterized protein n=1 Tax=Acanthosepion pharaonis TaxID=158019 RepID=A0A812DG09_ACAPH|nr:unnamed protein product [Sepia pharaonis]